MSNKEQSEDTTNNFIEVHDTKVSEIDIPNNPKRVIFQVDYDLKQGDVLPAADKIYNCLTPSQAHHLIEQLQQSLDALECGDARFVKIQKH